MFRVGEFRNDTGTNRDRWGPGYFAGFTQTIGIVTPLLFLTCSFFKEHVTEKNIEQNSSPGVSCENLKKYVGLAVGQDGSHPLYVHQQTKCASFDCAGEFRNDTDTRPPSPSRCLVQLRPSLNCCCLLQIDKGRAIKKTNI
jgi:hypothetical protein